MFVGPPLIVHNIIEKERCLSDFTVSWDPVTSDPVCGPVSYGVTISPSDGVMMMRIIYTSYNFTELQIGTNYTVTVAGRNRAGVGESRVRVINTTTMTEATPSGMYICVFFHYLYVLLHVVM